MELSACEFLHGPFPFTSPVCQCQNWVLGEIRCIFPQINNAHLCSRTLQGSDAMLPLSPSMIVCTLLADTMGDHGSVRLSVWTIQQMKMESGTLSLQ